MGFRFVSGFALPLAVTLAAIPLATASGGSATSLYDDVHLNTAVTVQGDSVTLGDLFEGYLPRPEKVVASAPPPGQRMVLTAEWLADVARTYGLDWQPAGSFDRAVVYQPGATIGSTEIIDAVKQALVAHGMPATHGVTVTTQVSPVTVSLAAPKGMDVREVVLDPIGKTFSVLVQIPPGDPQAALLPVHGIVFPTVQVPVLKEGIGKNITITAGMIDMIALPEDQVKGATLTDPDQIIGKTTKMFLRAGQPIRDNDIVQITYVEIPVLVSDVDRDQRIGGSDIKMLSVDAASVPVDAVTAAEFLVDKTARRTLAAGAPIRRADVTYVRQVEVPVPAHDIVRGATVTEDDITWKMVDETDLTGDIAMVVDEVVGQVARLTLRAGQPMRRHSIAKAIAVERGQVVIVLWSAGGMSLTAQGVATEKGAVGDVIRVTNTKSNQKVLAEIIDSRTVRIATQTSAR